MDGVGLWLTPLALLPGVGLLVMSTAARFGQLHQELHRHEEAGEAGVPQHLLRRATLFRNALVSLYLAVAMLAVASLAGGLALLWIDSAVVPVAVLSALAVLCVAFAAVELIRESMLLLRVIHEHGPHERPRDPE